MSFDSIVLPAFMLPSRIFFNSSIYFRWDSQNTRDEIKIKGKKDRDWDREK